MRTVNHPTTLPFLSKGEYMLPIVKICRTANSVKGIALFLFVRLKFYGFNVYMYATEMILKMNDI